LKASSRAIDVLRPTLWDVFKNALMISSWAEKEIMSI